MAWTKGKTNYTYGWMYVCANTWIIAHIVSYSSLNYRQKFQLIHIALYGAVELKKLVNAPAKSWTASVCVCMWIE